MSWQDELQPASFRGVPFAVLTGEGEFGRRVAVHEYPFRDKPWIEDIGRAARRIALTGFIVADDIKTGEADVKALRDRIVEAAETAGSGSLIHPTLGTLTVSLAQPVSIRERWDEGRYFELGFVFIEAGERTFPTAASDSSVVDDAAGVADEASATDFISTVIGVIDEGASVLERVTSVLSGFADAAILLIDDAANLYHLAASLPGVFGRYFGGRIFGFAGRSRVVITGSATVASLIYESVTARARVREAADALRTISPDDPEAVAAGAVDALVAFLAACPNPADAVRLTALLAQVSTTFVSTPSPVGISLAAAERATNALLRRASLSALARATMAYEPWSRDDALALRDVVASALSAEIVIAGDNAEDATYKGLRALRAILIADLNARGAALPAMQTFTFKAALPSLALAQRLYRDAAREEELVFEADPIHPAFMPQSFAALAT